MSIFGLKEGKIFTNNLGDKIKVLGLDKKTITYSINNTTFWCTDYDRFFFVIGR
jgi:hypothetical protein